MEYILFGNHFSVIGNSFEKELKKWFFCIQVKYKLIDLPQEKRYSGTNFSLQKDFFRILWNIFLTALNLKTNKN